MKVLVTGATGFTGSFVVRELLRHGFDVRCFMRPTSDVSRLPLSNVACVSGDLDEPSTLAKALEGINVLVNVASLGFGHAQDIVRVAEDAGVSRALFLSTTAIFTSLNAPSKAIRIQAEETIQQSNLLYTILRPTMIYGTSQDRNISRLIRYVQRYPVLPVLGSGEYLLQPVYVQDVAKALVQAIANEETVRQSYNIPGQTVVTFNDLVNTVARLLGRRLALVHLPSSPCIWGLTAAESLSIGLPIKAEQIKRLNEDKSFAAEPAAQAFGYAPCPLEDGLALELEEMGIG